MSPNQVIFETKRAGVLLFIPGQNKCKPGLYPGKLRWMITLLTLYLSAKHFIIKYLIIMATL